MIPGSCLLVGVRPLGDLDPGVHRHTTSREEHLNSLDGRVKRVPAPIGPIQNLSRIMRRFIHGPRVINSTSDDSHLGDAAE